MKIFTLLELYRKCISRIWTDLEKYLPEIENIQNTCIRSILKAPKSTPKPALLNDTGILPLESKIHQLQLAFYLLQLQSYLMAQPHGKTNDKL